jgi:transcriptional regulator with XRE-family HTH domain
MVSGMHTRLAHWRVFRGYSQNWLAMRSGVPLGTLRRIEQGAQARPPDMRHVGNLAVALGCRFEDLLEDEWKGWTVLPNGPRKPPAPEQHWESGPPPTLHRGGPRIPRKLDRDAAEARRRARRRTNG